MNNKTFLSAVGLMTLLLSFAAQDIYAAGYYKPYFRYYSGSGSLYDGIGTSLDPKAICDSFYQTFPYQRTITPLDPVTNSLRCTGSRHPTQQGIFAGGITVRSQYNCDCANGDNAFPSGAGLAPACFGFGPEVVCRPDRGCSEGRMFDPLIGQCVVSGDFDNIVQDKTPVTCSTQTSTPNPSTPNPIIFSSGNKVLVERDYVLRADNGLNFIRSYNAKLGVGIHSGVNWLANQLSQVYTAEASSTLDNQAIVVAADGVRLPFTYDGTEWGSDADINDTLVELKDDATSYRTGWIYTKNTSGDVQTYNAFGQLTAITKRNGLSQQMTYQNTPRFGALYSTQDPYGRSLFFSYNSIRRIATMTNPEGGLYQYGYSTDGNNNLISVTYPDNTVKQYLYEDANHPNALTGVIDENGSRYMTYTYDANGRAIDEISPNVGTDVNHYAMSYNPGVSTTVTIPNQSTRTYNFTTVLGVVKSTGTDQPAGAGCAAAGSNITYDANGNISTKTDFNGNQTTYTYDLTRNLETSRTEGLTTAGAATPETRTITTTWHPTWRLPLVISEYTGNSATGTPLRTTTTVYDDKGNITSVTVNDPVNNISRTTTINYTYSTAVPGLVLTKVVDGPRIDVNDTTTYQYYAHDAVCEDSTATPIIDPITGVTPANLGCRGQLQSMTNALGHATTYDRYNHHGQVEQMTDPNGLVTQNTYDLRQRLTSTTVGSELTHYQYDDVGQLDILTLPDGSQLDYDYDTAHRLTDITDSDGNHIHYTLDAMGNRTNEDTQDPNGSLTKTLSRSYDALNRLQQVTGIE